MRYALKLATVVFALGVIASCGRGGGGGGTAEIGTNTGSTTTPVTTTSTTSETAYAYDGALTNGTMGIMGADYESGGDFSGTIFEANVKNGKATIVIDKKQFDDNFINSPNGRAKYVRLCADGIDTEGNVYFGVDIYGESQKTAQELLGDPNKWYVYQVFDDALCVLVPTKDFDPENNSYFANPYTDVVDFLINYGYAKEDTISDLVSQIDQNLGITYKNVAHDALDAEDYVNTLANAFGVQTGKEWEWRAKILKEFLKLQPTFNTLDGRYAYTTILVKPQAIDPASVTTVTKDTCWYYYWSSQSQKLKSDLSLPCIKIPNTGVAVGVYNDGFIDWGLYLLVESGDVDANGNPIYYVVANPNNGAGGHLEDTLDAISYTHGIPLKLGTDYVCYDPNADKDVYIDKTTLANCYLDANNEITCEITGTVATDSNPNNEYKHPICDTNVINAGMEGQTVATKGIIYLSKDKRDGAMYGNDVLATYYDEIYQ